MIWFISLFVLSSNSAVAFSPKPLFGRVVHHHHLHHHHHHHGSRSYRPTTSTQRSMVMDPMMVWFGASDAETSASIMQAAVSHVHEILVSSTSSSSSSVLLSDAAAAAVSVDLNEIAVSAVSDVATAMGNVIDLATSSSSDAATAAAQVASDPSAAADAVAGAAAAAADDGWWQSYLNIFKTALLAVHETIDPPLRQLGVANTWGISIALFTASVRALLVPLSIQQTKSSEYMKALKPYMNEIKEKFKDNKDMQNRATAKLMEDANQNPLAGCFVSLLQIPVFLGLYRGVRLLAQEGRLQEPFLWIPSLEGPVSPPDYRGMDWLLQGWTQDVGAQFPHPALGWPTTLAFLVMPVVLVIGQSITMRVLQPPIDDNMSKEEKETMEKSQGLLRFLPLMIGFFSLQVPAGLTIYWFTSNLFTLSQSLLVRGYYKANPPVIELPDYWEALDDVSKMSPEDRRKAAEAGIASGPDFDELMDEARFHYMVARPPLRTDSVAWQRVQAANGATFSAPPELQEWVAASSSISHSISSSSDNDNDDASSPSVTNPPFYANVTTGASTTA